MFSTAHKFLLQQFMNRGVISQEQALDYLNESEVLIQDGINNVIATLNARISHQHFKILPRTCEVTGEKVYVLINNLADNENINTFCTRSAHEKHYFFNIVNAIITAEPVREASRTQCIQMRSNAGTLANNNNRVLAEKLLDEWIDAKYFVEERSNISLGPRLICQYELDLKKLYEDALDECMLCFEMVFRAAVCPGCSKTFHKHCLQRCFKKSDKEECPNCRDRWLSNF